MPRKNRRVALGIVLLIHVALLTAMLLSRAHRPAPPPRSVDLVLIQEKVPEKKANMITLPKSILNGI